MVTSHLLQAGIQDLLPSDVKTHLIFPPKTFHNLRALEKERGTTFTKCALDFHIAVLQMGNALAGPGPNG